MVIEFPRLRKPDTSDVLPAEVVVVMRNKNKIIAVSGAEDQSDLAGFGSTAAAALRDLAVRWMPQNTICRESISNSSFSV